MLRLAQMLGYDHRRRPARKCGKNRRTAGSMIIARRAGPRRNQPLHAQKERVSPGDRAPSEQCSLGAALIRGRVTRPGIGAPVPFSATSSRSACGTSASAEGLGIVQYRARFEREDRQRVRCRLTN